VEHLLYACYIAMVHVRYRFTVGVTDEHSSKLACSLVEIPKLHNPVMVRLEIIYAKIALEISVVMLQYRLQYRLQYHLQYQLQYQLQWSNFTSCSVCEKQKTEQKCNSWEHRAARTLQVYSRTTTIIIHYRTMTPV